MRAGASMRARHPCATNQAAPKMLDRGDKAAARRWWHRAAPPDRMADVL